MSRSSFYFCLLLLTGILIQSCSEHQELETTVNSDKKVTNRSILPDSFFEAHNEFILWVFKNHLDSAIYYAPDPGDFIEFVERRQYQFSGSTHDISDVLIDDGEYVFSYPYYVENEGFTNTENLWSEAEFDSLYVVLDSVLAAIGAEETENNVMKIINRGKNRINSVVNFTHKDELIGILTQAQYSFALMYDVEDEYGPPQFVGCLINAVSADISAYNFFAELGDTELGDPMNSFAQQAIAGVSVATFIHCFCPGCW